MTSDRTPGDSVPRSRLCCRLPYSPAKRDTITTGRLGKLVSGTAAVRVCVPSDHVRIGVRPASSGAGAHLQALLCKVPERHGLAGRLPQPALVLAQQLVDVGLPRPAARQPAVSTVLCFAQAKSANLGRCRSNLHALLPRSPELVDAPGKRTRVRASWVRLLARFSPEASVELAQAGVHWHQDRAARRVEHGAEGVQRHLVRHCPPPNHSEMSEPERAGLRMGGKRRAFGVCLRVRRRRSAGRCTACTPTGRSCRLCCGENATISATRIQEQRRLRAGPDGNGCGAGCKKGRAGEKSCRGRHWLSLQNRSSASWPHAATE